jgi:hypothetical protein
MPCRSATRSSLRGGEPVREMLVLSIILTAVAVAIYVSFA